MRPGEDIATIARDVSKDLGWAWSFDFLKFGRPTPGTSRHRPEVLFNYVGQPLRSANPLKLTITEEDPGPMYNPDNPREYRLAIRSEVSGDGIVSVHFVYDETTLVKAQIEELSNYVSATIAEAVAQLAG